MGKVLGYHFRVKAYDENRILPLDVSRLLCFFVFKKPATPLNDAQLGRYFFVLFFPYPERSTR